jgi:hypothetical protein
VKLQETNCLPPTRVIRTERGTSAQKSGGSNRSALFVCMSKKVRHRSIKASKRSSKPSDERAEASRQAAAKLVIGDLNLSLEFAKTALDLYDAGDREDAKRAKAAARKGYQAILRFVPEKKPTEPETRLIEAKLKELEQALKKIRRL